MMTQKLKTNICGVEFKTPVIAASGTFGYGLEYIKHTNIEEIGGISVKGISLNEAVGNNMPRLVETSSGLLNAIGLQNVGVEKFISDKLPILRKLDTRIIVNFWGKTIDEYIEVAKILDNTDIDMLEMNISCPNVKEGGISFSATPENTQEIVKAVRKVITNKPLIVKLSPNVTNIVDYAKVCENEGADSISLINTLLGMAIDIDNMKPILANKTGGLSGPAIKPVAVRMVYEVSKAVNIPIMGMGGISNYKDAIEFFLAGADIIQVGTANFINYNACVDIANGINTYLDNKNINHINDIVGKAVQY